MAILEEPTQTTQPLRNYIGGQWVESAGRLIDVVNPATQKVVNKVPI